MALSPPVATEASRGILVGGSRSDFSNTMWNILEMNIDNEVMSVSPGVERGDPESPRYTTYRQESIASKMTFQQDNDLRLECQNLQREQ